MLFVSSVGGRGVGPPVCSEPWKRQLGTGEGEFCGVGIHSSRDAEVALYGAIDGDAAVRPTSFLLHKKSHWVNRCHSIEEDGDAPSVTKNLSCTVIL